MTNNNQLPDYKEILENKTLSKQEKLERIFKLKNDYDQLLDKNLKDYKNRQYAGEAIQLATGVIPVTKLGTIGANLGEKFLAAQFGKKIAKDLGASFLPSTAAGGIFGLGQGIKDYKNPLFSAAKDAASAAVISGALGFGGAFAQKVHSAAQLNISKPTTSMIKAEKTNLRKMGKQYYKNYLQGRTVPSPIGQIYIPGSQAGEIGLHNYKMIPKIPKQIKSAQKVVSSNDKPYRLDSNGFQKLYNVSNGKKYEYIIRNNSNKTGHDFYQIKEVGPAPAYSDQPRALEPRPINSIPNFSKNFNYPNGYNFLKPQSDTVNPFTREQIGNMNTEEFLQNENLIMEQLNAMGIPTDAELHSTSGQVYVNSYTRADGTKVRGYYRSK